MAISRHNQMPMVFCPTCEQEFQWDDYYDVSVGHTRECPHCTNICEVIEVDQITVCAIQGMRAAEERGARMETRTDHPKGCNCDTCKAPFMPFEVGQ